MVYKTKSVLGSNLTQASGLGGIRNQAHRQQDKRAGIHSDTLLQLLAECSLRTEMKPGIFAGYAKNLGTSDELVSDQLYGTGTNLDKLITAGAELTYNVPHWKFELNIH